MKRTGLQRIACTSCGLSAYQTVAQLERGEMPAECWQCGAFMAPHDWDLAGLLYEQGRLSPDAYNAHPLTLEYQRRLGSLAHGQASHYRESHEAAPGELIRVRAGRKRFPARGGERVTDSGTILEDATAKADAEARKAWRESSRARQLSGLVQFQQAAQAAADIPF